MRAIVAEFAFLATRLMLAAFDRSHNCERHVTEGDKR